MTQIPTQDEIAALVQRLRPMDGCNLFDEAATALVALQAENVRLKKTVEVGVNVELLDQVQALQVRVAELDGDKKGLCNQIGKLLTTLDDWDKARADEHNGGLTMHTYGQTPDWYVEAAFWSCYGYAPDGPHAALPAADKGGE